MATFTTRQKVCIREKLRLYLAKEGDGKGKPLAVADLHVLLQEHYVIPSVRATMETRWKAEYEPLRRYIEGPTKSKNPKNSRPNFISQEWLPLLVDFLIDEGAITVEDLESMPKAPGAMRSERELEDIARDWSFERIISEWDTILPNQCSAPPTFSDDSLPFKLGPDYYRRWLERQLKERRRVLMRRSVNRFIVQRHIARFGGGSTRPV